ncbi:MAG: methionyl-tRNA formyltransferase [bacterium]|nr:methionyl-tRNA formyltransferase [bacterium]
MHDYAFVGNDETSLLFLERVFEKKPPRFIITGEDRIEGRGRKMTSSLPALFAEKNSLKCFKTNDPNSVEFLQKIHSEGSVDFFLVFSFGYYLKKTFLSLPKRMCVNIHPSLLPLYRGAAPLNRAIMNNDRKSGVTFFRMTSKMDAGPVIASREIAFDECETSVTFRNKVLAEAARLFLSFDWESDFALFEQDDSKATPANKIDKKELILNLNEDSCSVKSKINGLSEYGVKCLINEKPVKIRSASLSDSDYDKEPGSIIIEGKRIIVKCLKGSVFLNEIQPEGKKTMSAESFINGYKIKTGDKVCVEFLA